MFSHIHPDNYAQQLADKKQAMAHLFASFELPKIALFTSSPLHYRQRAEFRVWHEGEDLFYIMFNQQTKQKFRVDHFPVASRLINQAMTALIENIKLNKSLRFKLFQVDFYQP